MAINEQIVTGRKFRKLVDEASKLWQRISFWTKASDVEFDDGKNLEEKIDTLNSKMVKMVYLTEAEYQALGDQADPDTYYVTPEDPDEDEESETGE